MSPAVDLKHEIAVSESPPSHLKVTGMKGDAIIVDAATKQDSKNKPAERSSLSDNISEQENFTQSAALDSR